MKNLITLIFVSLLVTGCNGQHHSGKGYSSHSSSNSIHQSEFEQRNIEDLKYESVETFPTVGFKAVYKDTILYPVKEVFPLLKPQGRSLLYPNWNPTELRKGENGTVKDKSYSQSMTNLTTCLQLPTTTQKKDTFSVL